MRRILCKRDRDITKARGELRHLFGEKQAAFMEEGDVGGEAFDLGEVVGGKKNGRGAAGGSVE